MKPRHSLAAIAAVLIAAAIAIACGDTIIGGPTVITPVTVTQTQGGGAGTPGAPGSGSTVITHVKVTQFGEDCPSGISQSGADRSVRVGCTKNLTCTPFVGPNEPASPTVHGPSPDYFGVVAGASFAQVTTPSEPFNRDVRGTSSGVVSFRCVVRSVQSEQFDLTVIP